MAYEVTMGKMAVPEVTTGETQASKMTIQKARSKLARMNLVDQFLFDEVTSNNGKSEGTMLLGIHLLVC